MQSQPIVKFATVQKRVDNERKLPVARSEHESILQLVPS